MLLYFFQCWLTNILINSIILIHSFVLLKFKEFQISVFQVKDFFQYYQVCLKVNFHVLYFFFFLLATELTFFGSFLLLLAFCLFEEIPGKMVQIKEKLSEKKNITVKETIFLNSKLFSDVLLFNWQFIKTYVSISFFGLLIS